MYRIGPLLIGSGWLVWLGIGISGRMAWDNPLLRWPLIAFIGGTLASSMVALSDPENRLLSALSSLAGFVSFMAFGVFYFFLFGLV